jgi:hypothetical protein
MTEARANELRALITRELAAIDAEIVNLRDELSEKRARFIAIAELLSLLDLTRA